MATRTTRRWAPGALLLAGLGLVVLPTLASAAGPGDDDPASTSHLEWELLEAETAVSQGEPRIAASHYRAAVREARTLLGLLAVADGDLASAREHLDRARNGAAVGLGRSRVALALVELRLGQVEQPLRELRFVSEENPEDTSLLALFLTALRSTSQNSNAPNEELDAGIERLRTLDPAAAERLGEASIRESPLPEVGSFAILDSDGRAMLRSRLVATVIRSLRNLAVAERDSGFLASTADHLALAATLEAGHEIGEPWGRLDLEAGDSKPRVLPPRLDLVALIQSEPAELRPALGLLDAGDRDGALTKLRDQLDGAGNDARSLLGRILVDGGAIEAGRQELLTAAEGRLGSPTAQQTLARLEFLDAAESSSTDEGIPTQAVYHLRRAALRSDLDRDLALVLADAEIDAGRGAEAERQLSSLDKRFGSVEAVLRRVAQALAEGREKDALEAAERATQLAPNSEEVLRTHGRLALDVGIVNAAGRSIEPLVRMRPEVAEYRVLLGRAWQQRRKMGEASEALLKAVELDPDYAPAWLPLGLALAHENRFEEARSYFERVLADRPWELEALAGLAETEERLGDAEAAESRARSVLEHDPGHARAHLVLGMVAMGRGEFETGRDAFEKAVARDPMLAKAHYQLSQACARLRDRDCAREHLALYRTALEGPEATFVQLERAEGPQPMTRQMGSEGGSKQ